MVDEAEKLAVSHRDFMTLAEICLAPPAYDVSVDEHRAKLYAYMRDFKRQGANFAQYVFQHLAEKRTFAMALSLSRSLARAL